MRDARVLLVGAGGLGSPAALVLAESGVGSLTLIDDDVVELSNLHRQVLYSDGDIGKSKTACAARRLSGAGASVDVLDGRLLPDNAVRLFSRFDLVVEGADNFATKFLAADACQIAGVPLVQAGAVRWQGWALATLPKQSACMRCVFEDIPTDRVETCAQAGVVGPVVGLLGALEAALAIRLLSGDVTAAGELWSYDALRPRPLRASRVNPRAGCHSCAGLIPTPLTFERYAPPVCQPH